MNIQRSKMMIVRLTGLFSLLALVVMTPTLADDTASDEPVVNEAEAPAEKSAEVEWLTDFDKAKALALETKRPILVNFSGSDWCGWCIKLDEEVLEKSEFKTFAADNLVLFVADFPRSKEQSDELKAQNKGLLEKFGVQGFPTILLVDSEGEVLTRTGYRPGGPEAYVAHIKEELASTKYATTASDDAETTKTAEAHGAWLTDYEEARAQAGKQSRPILVNFSGSDWCGWCIKLDEEVFEKEEFKKFADEKLVLFVADFPRSKEQADELKTQNRSLMEKYGIQGFPTILLLDAEGEVIGRTGYQAGGPENYVKHLEELLAKPSADSE